LSLLSKSFSISMAYVVTVHQAKDIPKIGLLGYPDACFKIKLAGQTKQTTVKYNCAAAEWNEILKFEVPSEVETPMDTFDEFEIRGLDQDQIGPDQMFGKAKFQLDSFENTAFDGWVNLKSSDGSGSGGAVRLSIDYIAEKLPAF